MLYYTCKDLLNFWSDVDGLTSVAVCIANKLHSSEGLET